MAEDTAVRGVSVRGALMCVSARCVCRCVVRWCVSVPCVLRCVSASCASVRGALVCGVVRTLERGVRRVWCVCGWVRLCSARCVCWCAVRWWCVGMWCVCVGVWCVCGLGCGGGGLCQCTVCVGVRCVGVVLRVDGRPVFIAVRVQVCVLNNINEYHRIRVRALHQEDRRFSP
jgi:hypothetical protein